MIPSSRSTAMPTSLHHQIAGEAVGRLNDDGANAVASNPGKGHRQGRVASQSDQRRCRIAGQVRRELGRRHGIQSTSAHEAHPESIGSCDPIEQPSQAGAPENDRNDCSQRLAKPRCAVRHKSIPGAVTLASAAHGWCLAGFLPAVHRSHFMNFRSARVCLVLAPCR